VHSNPTLCAHLQRLCRDLRVTVKHDLTDIRDRQTHIGLLAPTDHELVSRASDNRTVLDHVDRLAVGMLRQQSYEITVASVSTTKSRFLRQANRCERAPGTQTIIVGNRRPFDRLAERSCAVDRRTHLCAELVIECDADRDIVCVVANTPLSDRTPVCGLDKHCVRADLDPIASPGLARPRRAGGLASLVLVGNELAAPRTQDVNSTSDSEVAVLELEPLDSVALGHGDLDMEAPTSVDRRIRFS